MGDWLSVHGITPCPFLFALRFCIVAHSYKYCPTAATWHCVNEGYLMETDYLVIGAGAMGLAFADAIHKEKPRSKIVIIEKRPLPGGHWVDDYRFVALHQPAAFYGVGSLELSPGGNDLSSHAELVYYYDRVVKQLQKSSAITFFFRTEYKGGGLAVPLLNPDKPIKIQVKEKVVDASYMKVLTPSTHSPNFKVGDGVKFVPINDLLDLQHKPKRFCVIGGGKTGADAVVHLIDNGVLADQIKWVVPNDMWFWNRSKVQTGIVGNEFIKFLKAIQNNSSVEQIFLELEKKGSLFRLLDDELPRKWRCATFSEREFKVLKSVKDVVRKGRVHAIGIDRIELDNGSVAYEEGCLFIDCTANGLAARPKEAIFSDKHITLQSVLMCQQTYSAALIGKIESARMSLKEKNAILKPVPHPERVEDMPDILVASFENNIRVVKKIPFWFRKNRLSVGAHVSFLNFCSLIVKSLLLTPKAKLALKRIASNSSH